MTDAADSSENPVEITVEEPEDGMRLDSFLAHRFSSLSRAKIQRAVSAGSARVGDVVCKSSFKLSAGQAITFTPPQSVPDNPIPENIPLDIIYEDEHLVGINKPPAMVVHPAKGHWSGTLTSALAFHFENLSSIGGAARPGIVHRLDRDTSGIIIVAKTDQAHSNLAMQFEQRTVQKTYWAIVAPYPDRDRDEIEQPIGAHPYQREKMAIRKDHKTSRAAMTFYEVLERHGKFALLAVSPKTGRTHQIRVHLAHIGSPVLCDKLYSGHSRITRAELAGRRPTESDERDDAMLERQALHARSIQFAHPITNEPLTLEAPFADDLAAAWKWIKDSAASNRRET